MAVRKVMKNGVAVGRQTSLALPVTPKVRADESAEQTRGKRASSRRGSAGANLVIFGPPGTGKTRRLVEEARTAPGVVTFCSHARATARAAVQSVGEVPATWTVGTIHSLCFRRLGLSRAQVVADHNLQDFCKRTGFLLDGDEDKPSELRFYLHCHSFSRARGIPYQKAYELCGAAGSRTEYDDFNHQYDQWRRAYGFVDYTDMLYLCAERGFEFPVGTLIIDEAQDLTPLHWRVILRLMEVADRVVIAGDDDQAIYEWSGADPAGMVNFADATGAEDIVLAQSYRVPVRVFELATQITDRIRERKAKEYLPTPLIGTVTRTTVLSKDLLRDAYKRGSVMMLFRNKYMRASYERLLQDARVPYITERGTGPLQQRSGRSYAMLAEGRWHEANDVRVLRAGLTPYGVQVADSIGYEAVATGVVEGSRPTDFIKCTGSVAGYLRCFKPGVRPIDMRTIHASKGLEADTVIVVSSLTKKSLESMYVNADAEHRVAYVAATRAKTTLVIVEENAAYNFPA